MPGMFRCVASDRPPVPGLRDDEQRRVHITSFVPAASHLGAGARSAVPAPKPPSPSLLPLSSHFFRQRVVPLLPIFRVTGCRAGRSLLFVRLPTETRPSQGADHPGPLEVRYGLRARHHIWPPLRPIRLSFELEEVGVDSAHWPSVGARGTRRQPPGHTMRDDPPDELGPGARRGFESRCPGKLLRARI